MQTSTSNPSSTDIDDLTRAEAEVAAREAHRAHGLVAAEQSSEGWAPELKPALIAAVAVATVAAVAGVVMLTRRSKRSRWLPPERSSAFGTAARGAGMFLLRLVARQVASQILAKVDGATTPAAAGASDLPPLRAL
jgi:hypothetical protein